MEKKSIEHSYDEGHYRGTYTEFFYERNSEEIPKSFLQGKENLSNQDTSAS